MKAKKLLYWFGGVLGVILLGAIANGVWARILSPVLSWLADVVIRFFSLISITFKNNIYQEAAKGFHENPSIEILALFIIIVLSIFTASLRTIYKLEFKRPNPKSKISKRGYVSVCILVLVLCCLFLSTLFKLQYVNRIITKSFNSIDIVAPFIEEKEYFSLKSDFLRIKNAEDYEDFHRKMVELSDKHKIELPLFKPL